MIVVLRLQFEEVPVPHLVRLTAIPRVGTEGEGRVSIVQTLVSDLKAP